MYPPKQLKLHERCVDCLDMIIKAKNMSEESKLTLRRYDNAKDDFQPIRLFRTRPEIEAEIARWDAVRVRLTLWYCDIMERIVAPVMNYEALKK